MTMIVECESCRSRFHLKESLLKESKAVRFRCRKCGGSIMVRNPHAPPATSVSAISAEKDDAPVEVDVSSWIQSDPEPPTPHETPIPSPIVTRLGNLVIFPPREDVGPTRFPPRRKPSLGKSMVVAGISILLLAGVALYFGTTEGGRELVGDWFPSRRSVPQVKAAPRPAYDVREMKSAVHEQAVSGNLFMVRGTVVNVGKGTSRGILMRATLLGEDNQVLMESTSIAGNLIDETSLRHMSRNPIEADLKMEYREGEEHRDIPPGKSLPFMVVFFDPPGKIGSFTVHAVDAD